eukprot:6242367-Heterocapsa_arctica.AAC.1
MVWGETSDNGIWTAITETRNHRGGYHSFMIKVINKECVMVKATPRNGIPSKPGKGGKGSGGRPSEDGGSDRGYQGGKDKGNDGKGTKGQTEGNNGKEYGAPWHQGGKQGGQNPWAGASPWATTVASGEDRTAERGAPRPRTAAGHQDDTTRGGTEGM